MAGYPGIWPGAWPGVWPGASMAGCLARSVAEYRVRAWTGMGFDARTRAHPGTHRRAGQGEDGSALSSVEMSTCTTSSSKLHNLLLHSLLLKIAQPPF
jgi:hypothetical protein